MDPFAGALRGVFEPQPQGERIVNERRVSTGASTETLSVKTEIFLACDCLFGKTGGERLLASLS